LVTFVREPRNYGQKDATALSKPKQIYGGSSMDVLKQDIGNTELGLTVDSIETELVFEELEDRIAPDIHGGCATSSSCNCSSSSCVVYG